VRKFTERLQHLEQRSAGWMSSEKADGCDNRDNCNESLLWPDFSSSKFSRPTQASALIVAPVLYSSIPFVSAQWYSKFPTGTTVSFLIRRFEFPDHVIGNGINWILTCSRF
jgi:hypothetical protein